MPKRRQRRYPYRRGWRDWPLYYRQLLIGGGLLSLTVALVGGVAYLTRLPQWLLTTVDVVGVTTLNSAELAARAGAVLDESYAGIIPHRFVPLYPEAAVVEALHAEPHVRSVTLSLPNRQTLEIAVEEYTPDALWCTERQPEAPCYFVDETGFAYAPAPPLLGGVFVRYVTPATQPGRGPIPFRETQQRSEVVQSLLGAATGFRTTTVVITPVGDEEYWFGDDRHIKISADTDPEQVTSDLVAIMNDEEFSYLQTGDFSYVDLRFGEKVYVQNRLAVATGTATSTLAE
jgi:hypothetical protein